MWEINRSKMGKETIKQVTASDTDYGVNILASGVTFNQ